MRKKTLIIINLLIICFFISIVIVYFIYFAKPETKEIINDFINNKTKNIHASVTQISNVFKKSNQRKKIQKKQKIANLHSSILNNLEKKDYAYSLKLIQYLKKEIKQPGLLLLEAQVLFKLEDKEKAVLILKNGIKKYKKLNKFHQILSSIYLYNNNYQATINVLKKLNQQQHTEKTILYLYLAYINSGNFKKAKFILKKYKHKIDNFSSNTTKSLFYFFTAIYYFNTDDCKSAEDYFERSYNLNSNNSTQFLYCLGNIYLLNKNNESLSALLENYDHSSIKQAELLHIIANFYIILGNIDKSRQILEKLTSIDKYNTNYLLMLTDLYQKKGEYEKSFSIFQKYLTIKPLTNQKYDKVKKFIYLADKIDQNQSLEKIMLQVQEKFPENKDVKKDLAKYYFSQDDFEKSIQILEKGRLGEKDQLDIQDLLIQIKNISIKNKSSIENNYLLFREQYSKQAIPYIRLITYYLKEKKIPEAQREMMRFQLLIQHKELKDFIPYYKYFEIIIKSYDNQWQQANLILQSLDKKTIEMAINQAIFKIKNNKLMDAENELLYILNQTNIEHWKAICYFYLAVIYFKFNDINKTKDFLDNALVLSHNLHLSIPKIKLLQGELNQY